MISDHLIQRIKIEEGFRRFPYFDIEGNITIGYGRNLRSVGISEEEAEILQGDSPRMFSSCRLHPTKYLEDYLIGYGYNLTRYGISNEIAEIFLFNDLEEAFLRATRYLDGILLDDIRFEVIIDMCFNMGNKIFGFDKLQKALKEYDYDIAMFEMLDSIWARKLKTRAANLAKQMQTGKRTV
jgi:GH24 family phage-related lysozyme (muramidase)